MTSRPSYRYVCILSATIKLLVIPILILCMVISFPRACFRIRK